MPLDFTLDGLHVGRTMRQAGFTIEHLRENPHLFEEWVDQIGPDLFYELANDWQFLCVGALLSVANTTTTSSGSTWRDVVQARPEQVPSGPRT